MYETGLSVPQNYEESSLWYSKATKNDMDIAQNNLGILYINGLGVSRDYKIATKLFKRASKHDLPEAWNNLAYMYLTV